jgi:Fur family transcriptional regulator, peroxide stress response regulator
MHPIPELLQIIRERGGKITPQRLAIYETLQADSTHPSAEAVYERIRATMPTVSLATVYKTLNELVALGELRRFDINGVSHFDARTDPHAEVVCLSCDIIMDVAAPGAPPAPAIPGFEIIGQTQTFYGYCSQCREATAAGGI